MRGDTKMEAKLTHGQVFKLIAIQLFTTMIAFISSNIIILGGYNGPLSVILGYILALMIIYPMIVLARRRPDEFFVQYGKKIVGKWLHPIFMLFMIMALIYIAIINMWQLSDFLIQFYLVGTPTWVIITICAMIIAYIAYSGVTTVFRAAEGLFPLVIVAFLSIPLFVSDNIRWYMAKALINHIDFIHTWAATYTSASIFGEVVFIIFIIPHVTMDKKIFKIIGSAGGVAVVTIMCHLIPLLLIFGPDLAGNFNYPDLELLRFMRSGSFLETLDPLLIILWVICIFIKISFIMYVVATVISQMLGLKESRPIVLPVVATVSLMSLVVVQSSAQFLELETSGFATMLMIAELIPILYLVVDLIRFGKKKPAKQGGAK
jgi:spore germination protein KB